PLHPLAQGRRRARHALLRPAVHGPGGEGRRAPSGLGGRQPPRHGQSARAHRRPPGRPRRTSRSVSTAIHRQRHARPRPGAGHPGPRPPHAARSPARTFPREVHQDRFTSLDRDIGRLAVDGIVTLRSDTRTRQDPVTLTARMQHLVELRLAERVSATSWRLAPDWAAHLRELGTRGDIIKQMHAALHGDPARYRALDAPLPERPSPTLYGRVAAKGLSDELAGKYYAIIETPDGAGYHIPLGNRAAEELRRGDLVAFLLVAGWTRGNLTTQGGGGAPG